MKKTLLSIIIFVSLLCLNARVLTLEEAVDIALKNSDTIKKENIKSDNVRSSYNTTLLDIIPDLNVSYGWNHTRNSSSQSSGISISKSIQSTLPDYFNWKSAKHNIAINSIQNESIKKNIAWNILDLYVKLLMNQKQYSLYENSYNQQQRLFNECKLLKKQGLKTNFEYNKVEISTLKAELSLLNAKNSLDKSMRNLCNELNIKSDTLSLVDINTESITDLDFDIEKEKPINIIISEMSLEHSKFLLNQNKIGFFPNLSLSWSYNSSSVKDKPLDVTNYVDSYSYGLSASYSLLTPFKVHESYGRAKKQIRISQIDLGKEIRDIKNNYENILIDLDYLSQQKLINDKLLSQAEKNLEIANNNFKIGIIRSIELEDARNEYNDAEISNIDITYQVYLKKQELNHLLSRKIANRW